MSKNSIILSWKDKLCKGNECMRNKVEKSYFRMIKKLLMFVFCVISLFAVDNVYAAERRIVRVAFFPMDG